MQKIGVIKDDLAILRASLDKESFNFVDQDVLSRLSKEVDNAWSILSVFSNDDTVIGKLGKEYLDSLCSLRSSVRFWLRHKDLSLVSMKEAINDKLSSPVFCGLLYKDFLNIKKRL